MDEALVLGAVMEDDDKVLYQMLWVVNDVEKYKAMLIENNALELHIEMLRDTIKGLQTTLDYFSAGA